MSTEPEDLPNPTFVNTVAISGFANGNINMALSATRWYPKFDDEAKKTVVAVDETILVDLRFDLLCAQQMRDALNRIIDENTKPMVTN